MYVHLSLRRPQSQGSARWLDAVMLTVMTLSKFVISRPQERFCSVLRLAAAVPSPTWKNWWNTWGIITNPTYSFCKFHPQLLFSIKDLLLCHETFSFQLRELSHKVAIVPRPPHSPAHLFQSAASQAKGDWHCATLRQRWLQPKSDSCGHKPEPSAAGFYVQTPGDDFSNTKFRQLRPPAELCCCASTRSHRHIKPGRSIRTAGTQEGSSRSAPLHWLGCSDGASW